MSDHDMFDIGTGADNMRIANRKVRLCAWAGVVRRVEWCH